MRKVVMAAVATLAMAGAASATDSITTLFASNNQGNNGGAVYFTANVLNPAGLVIDAFDMNSLANPGFSFDVQIFTTAGGHAGNETNQGVWNMVATGTGTTAGPQNPSNVNTTDFVLAPGLWGIAIIFTHSDPGVSSGHTYTNGTGGNEFFSNADIALTLGSATNVPFTGGVFSPRVWNGTIYYKAVPAPGALALLGVAGLVARRRRRA